MELDPQFAKAVFRKATALKKLASVPLHCVLIVVDVIGIEQARGGGGGGGRRRVVYHVSRDFAFFFATAVVVVVVGWMFTSFLCGCVFTVSGDWMLDAADLVLVSLQSYYIVLQLLLFLTVLRMFGR